MATVADAARAGALAGSDYNTTYQKGNDNASTPNPTWLTMHAYPNSIAVETHIGFAYETGVDNTADAWLPLLTATFLTSTPATVR